MYFPFCAHNECAYAHEAQRKGADQDFSDTLLVSSISTVVQVIQSSASTSAEMAQSTSGIIVDFVYCWPLEVTFEEAPHLPRPGGAVPREERGKGDEKDHTIVAKCQNPAK